MAQIAILGTGLLGSGFAQAAAGRGHTVVVWNRSMEKARKLEQFGVRVAATPAEAVAGATRVHLVLKDDAVVEEVLAAARVGLAAGTIICDHTTTLPALTAERTVRLNNEGVRYLHCPVFMGPAAARAGEGVIMASGPSALFGEVRTALERMTGRVEYLGERPDAAACYKLFGNTLIIGIAATLADVFTIAKASGITAPDSMKLLDFFNPAATIPLRGRNMAKGDFTPSFELVMARKDVRLMMETAGAAPLCALPAVAARMDALIAAGHGADDVGVIAKDALL